MLTHNVTISTWGQIQNYIVMNMQPLQGDIPTYCFMNEQVDTNLNVTCTGTNMEGMIFLGIQ